MLVPRHNTQKWTNRSAFFYCSVPYRNRLLSDPKKRNGRYAGSSPVGITKYIVMKKLTLIETIWIIIVGLSILGMILKMTGMISITWGMILAPVVCFNVLITAIICITLLIISI